MTCPEFFFQIFNIQYRSGREGKISILYVKYRLETIILFFFLELDFLKSRCHFLMFSWHTGNCACGLTERVNIFGHHYLIQVVAVVNFNNVHCSNFTQYNGLAAHRDDRVRLITFTGTCN